MVGGLNALKAEAAQQLLAQFIELSPRTAWSFIRAVGGEGRGATRINGESADGFWQLQPNPLQDRLPNVRKPKFFCPQHHISAVDHRIVDF